MHRFTPRTKGFTLIELLVVISIIALLISIMLPALAAVRRMVLRLESNNNIRSIVQVLAADASQDARALTSERITGDGSVRDRFTRLASRCSDPMPPATFTNPVSTDRDYDGDIANLRPHGSEQLGADNVSYALIHHESIVWTSWSSRSSEPVIADERLDGDGGSYWNRDRWEGGVGWQDGRVKWENEPRMSVHYRNDQRREDHDLWEQAGDGTNNRLVNP